MCQLRILSIALFFWIALGCHSDKPKKVLKSHPTSIRVALILEKSAKTDKSFNDSAVRGALRAEKELGIQLKLVECEKRAQIEKEMSQLAQKGYQLLITTGFDQAEPMASLSKRFPKTHFAIVDTPVSFSNGASLLFAEHEGSFLVGYLAALKSKTGTLGFIGGMNVDLIKRFELGYRAGARFAKPKIKVITNYIGRTSRAWLNPSKGKKLALKQISKGADIIFAAAGASGLGVFDAVEEAGKLAIGVDSNQNSIKPGFILTSMLKRVDSAIYNIIKLENEGNFTGGNKYYGLADKGVDYAIDEHNQSLIDKETYNKVEAIRRDILKGSIVVPDYYITKDLCPKKPFNCRRLPRKVEEPGKTVQ